MRRSDCPIGCALDVVGDRWTLLIIRDALYKGFKSYNEFLSSPEKISTNILAARLQKLTAYGIFEKQKNEQNQLKIDYVLTEKGKDLAPIMMELGKWGMKHIDNTVDMLAKIREAKNN
ncbi:helix-turn-helix domain-containing protein [Fulvivirgaceae bacterium BMA10]|uniref:Helix-turn-helix domain-containing protein n=1 Tax=Splendidivirga corallicola TaxID=3051826 RepID=A0ABT8KVH2_9BACT|nr:helix-turn-helix domain-containing protein [Fulvivirgaceae bacterium BMA10]